MSPELSTVIEWSKLGVNTLYIGAIVYLFKILQALQKESLERHLSLTERYHALVERNVLAFEAILREVKEDK